MLLEPVMEKDVTTPKREMKKMSLLGSKKAQKPKMKNAFSALGDTSSSESEAATGTPNTTTPTESVCAFSDDEPQKEPLALVQEEVSDDWSSAPARRKPRAVRPKAQVIQAPKQAPVQEEECSSDEVDADNEWFVRKGQRHGHSKKQKQEWNYKSLVRVADATQKRSEQRWSPQSVSEPHEEEEP